MKHFFIVLASLITSLLIVAFPIYGSNSMIVSAAPVDNNCYTLDQWLQYYNMSDSDKYIYAKVIYRYGSSDGFGSYDCASIFFKTSSNINPMYNWDEQNSIFTAYGGKFNVKRSIGSNNGPDYYAPRDAHYQWGSENVTFDLVNQTFNVPNAGYTIQTLLDFQTNYVELDPHPDLDITFTPSLSGNVDRTVNGTLSEEIVMEVDNHSSHGAQIMLAIVPHGGSISFYDNSDSLQDKDVSGVVNPNASNFTFIWWSDEFNYNFDSTIQTTSPHAHAPDFSEMFVATKQISPSPWHYIAPRQNDYVHKFSWSQIPLDKYSTYDVYVYALINDYGYASRQAAFPSGDYYVDYSDIEIVYSSSFTLQNGYTFNVNDRSNGNYVVDTAAQLTNLGLSSKGYIDDDNTAHIEEKTVNDFLENHKSKMSDWQDWYQQPVISGSSSQSTSFDSVSSIITPFVKFISSGINLLPSIFQSVFYLGLFAIVCLAIFKRVIQS